MTWPPCCAFCLANSIDRRRRSYARARVTECWMPLQRMAKVSAPIIILKQARNATTPIRLAIRRTIYFG